MSKSRQLVLIMWLSETEMIFSEGQILLVVVLSFWLQSKQNRHWCFLICFSVMCYFPGLPPKLLQRKKKKPDINFVLFYKRQSSSHQWGQWEKILLPYPEVLGCFTPGLFNTLLQYLTMCEEMFTSPAISQKQIIAVLVFCFISSWHYDSFNQHYSH